MSRRFATAALVVASLITGVAACSAPGSAPPANHTSSSGSGSSGSGSGGTSGSGGSGSGGTVISDGPASIPFTVSDEFIPSGFMGDAPTDFNNVQMSADSTKCLTRQAGVKGSCYTIGWTPTRLDGAASSWVGVYWQYPANNWGGKVGRTVATGATKVTFLAAGAAGGEEVEFIAGGVNVTGGNAALTNADSFTSNTTVTLTTAWQPYEISLSGDSYSSVIGGFAWTITTSSTSPVTFYIDDIEWQ